MKKHGNLALAFQPTEETLKSTKKCKLKKKELFLGSSVAFFWQLFSAQSKLRQSMKSDETYSLVSKVLKYKIKMTIIMIILSYGK